MGSYVEVVGEVLVESISALVLLGGALGAALGLALLISPVHVQRLDRWASRWLATDVLFALLNTRRHSGRLLYRHHRLVGALFIAGSLYTFQFLLLGFDAGATIAMLGQVAAIDTLLATWLTHSLAVLLVLGSATALTVGAVMLLRPSVLRGIEVWADRWFSPEAAFLHLNTRIDLPFRLVHRFPRRFGAVCLLAGVYLLIHGLALQP